MIHFLYEILRDGTKDANSIQCKYLGTQDTEKDRLDIGAYYLKSLINEDKMCDII